MGDAFKMQLMSTSFSVVLDTITDISLNSGYVAK